jgi:hypothetical protein
MITLLFFLTSAHAQILPVSPQSYQLERLVINSEQQLKEIRELLANNKEDRKAEEKAVQILEQMSAGIDRSLADLQGTPTYEQAMLRLQKEQLARPDAKNGFAQQALQANSADLDQQRKLAEVLKTAPPAFVPKLQTQIGLESWRAQTRLSTQLSDLSLQIQDLRQDMRARGGGFLEQLVRGADQQNEKQREALP